MAIFPQKLTLLPQRLSASERFSDSKSNYSLALKNPILAHVERCSSMAELRQLHAKMITTGLVRETFAASRLVAFCALSLQGDLNYALALFLQIPAPNLFLWNAMIRAFSRSNHPELSLRFYVDMLLSSCAPDSYTFPFLLKSCAEMNAASEGQQVHAHAVKSGLAIDGFVSNSLVHFYAELGESAVAQKVFDKIPEAARNEVSWAAMITGFINNGRPKEALSLFCSKDWKRTGVDQVTLATVLTACARLGDLQLGREIHSFIEEERVEINLILYNSLLSMYAKCGDLDVARAIFRGMPYDRKDHISWNVLISGVAQQGHLKEALELFSEMKSCCNIRANEATLLSLISACRQLDDARVIHDNARDFGFESNVTICNALIDMYSKMANVELAREIFDRMPQRDIISWNSMIAGYTRCRSMELARKVFDAMPVRDNYSWSSMIIGYTRNKEPKQAMRLYKDLQSKGNIKPDSITLLNVLNVCSDLTALEEGKAVHKYMENHKMEVDVALGTALIDMYTKCGCLDEAIRVFERMNEKDVFAWTAMITGLAMHGRGEEALSVFSKMQDIDGESAAMPNSVTFLSVLSACSHSGLVEEGRKIYRSMSNYGIKPNLGHIGCMVDLLGRAGHLREALEFITQNISQLEYEVNAASVWGALLNACRIHGDAELGEVVAKKMLEVEPADDGALVLMSNIYAEAGRWRESKAIRKHMEEEEIAKEVGRSWIEVDGQLQHFTAGKNEMP
ncbi:Pentatricopeptide repeat-containing protein [Apostasia shenzhenica]|uniref:Pentatricopeptide repeat-containing protein n=1 Tax=Apostasia shenzhenica TaxID=1088818 RepID=A0A2I0B6M4_9ASPA|nr:Pentatricopeptide repeat-containing protein [Apostasia shenzhenica]